MLAHYVAQELPSTFAAVMPWFGTPLLGFAAGSQMQVVRDAASIRQTAKLQLHDRSDKTIPWQGGATASYWLYEPLEKVQDLWAAVHGCTKLAKPIKTAWDGGKTNLQCFEYDGCSSGRRVMRCFYDGHHGDYPADGAGDELNVWFMLQFQRSDVPIITNPSDNATLVDAIGGDRTTMLV
jgi:poly(3-hydroxybutyrate) depolymerase